jgi:hypothetical protein
VPRKNDPIDKYELRIPTRRPVGVTIATLVMNTPHVELPTFDRYQRQATKVWQRTRAGRLQNRLEVAFGLEFAQRTCRGPCGPMPRVMQPAFVALYHCLIGGRRPSDAGLLSAQRQCE